MRRFFILALLAAIAMPQAAQAQSANIIAGFENWVTSGGLPGSASFNGSGTATYTSTNGSISSQAASTDGTFGSSTLATADATSDGNNDGSRLTNGANHTYTFTFTDTSGSDTDLDSFHFDLGTFRPGSARTWTLSVDAGGSITAAAAFATGTIDPGTGGAINFFDIDVDLTSLADSTLDANGTAIFTLELSGGNEATSQHGLLDNVALSSVPVAQGPIIAGFETWVPTSGFPGAASFENTGTGTYESTSGSRDPGAASADGTFGSNTVNAADATTESSADGARVTNGGSATYTFTFTDTSGSDTDLGFFHFDFGTFRPNSSRTWTLSSAAGGSISESAAFATGSIGAGTGGEVDFFDIDVSLAGLSDSTLDANGTAIFVLELSGGTVGAAGHNALLDNVAISAAAEEEPDVLLGDVNLDGEVSFSDITPFIGVLSGSGIPNQPEADCDESGEVNFSDITPFIAILSGGGA